jgi:hypothetical protein
VPAAGRWLPAGGVFAGAAVGATVAGAEAEPLGTEEAGVICLALPRDGRPAALVLDGEEAAVLEGLEPRPEPPRALEIAPEFRSDPAGATPPGVERIPRAFAALTPAPVACAVDG